MFDKLLKHFSPLATIYNSLVVVKSAFQQFEINQLCYDPIQTEQVEETFNYDPYASIDQESFITSDTEEDFMLVDKLIETVDDGYCLAHLITKTEYGSNSIPAFYSNVSAAPLINCAYNFAAVLIENMAYTFICGAVLSCNLVWSERKFLEDLVQGKSEKLFNFPIVCSASTSTQPKMRGFGVDFGAAPGINFGLPLSTENHHSQDTTPRNHTSDWKNKKIDLAANICFTQKLFGITPSKKIVRFNQEKYKNEYVDNWELVERNYHINSYSNCCL
jgi:hypothetical protein